MTERYTNYLNLFVGHFDTEVLSDIRKSTQKGMALGNNRFKSEIETLSGRRVKGLKRGPKKQKLD